LTLNLRLGFFRERRRRKRIREAKDRPDPADEADFDTGDAPGSPVKKGLSIERRPAAAKPDSDFSLALAP